MIHYLTAQPTRGLTTLFLLLFVGTISAQSLLDMAIKLDSLYDALDENDEEAPGAFFDELQKLYGQEGDLDIFNINTDFADNRYMNDQVAIVYGELNLASHESSNQLIELDRQRDSLMQRALGEAERSCLGGPCAIQIAINEFKAQTNLENLQALRKKAIEEKPKKEKLINELVYIEAEIYDIDRQKVELKEGTETVLRLSAEANGGLPFASNMSNVQSLSPIIVQSAGGGSFQSNLLDGASKWIAERMREELSIAFFDRFKTWVAGENVYQLFPNTFSALGASATTDYSLMIQILKTAFEKDLQSMPFNMSGYLRAELNEEELTAESNRLIAQAFTDFQNSQSHYEERLQQFEKTEGQLQDMYQLRHEGGAVNEEMLVALEEKLPVFQYLSEEYNVERLEYTEQRLEQLRNRSESQQQTLRYVLFAISAIEQLVEGQHPTALLSTLNENIDELFPQANNIKPALLVVDVISRSLISVDPEHNTAWARGNKLQRLSEDAQLRNFYFGLIFQEVKQTIRRKRAKLELEKREIAEETVLLGEGGRLAAERMEYSTLTVEGILNELDLQILIQKEDSTEQLAERLMSNYNYYSPEDQSYIQVAIERMHRSIKEDHNLALVYDDDEFLEIDEAFTSAISRLEEKVKAVYNFYEVPDLNYDLPVIRNSLNLVKTQPGLEAEEELNVYIDNYNQAYEAWWDYSSIPDNNQTAYDDIYAVYTEVYTAAIERQLFFNPIYASLGPIRDAVKQEFYEQVARPDSIEIIEAAEREYPRLQQLNIRLDQLDQQQVFVDNLLGNNSYSFGNLVNRFLQFTDRIDQIQMQFKELRDRSETGLGSQEFVFLLKNSLDVLPLIFSIALPEDDSETLQTILSLTEKTLDAYSAVLEEDYDAIVMNLVSIAGSLIDESYEDRLNGPLSSYLTLGAPVDTVQIRSLQDQSTRRLNEVFRYGAFLAAVVESESSDDIKNAIRAIALPSGSYSIKRRSFANISLNAYPGLTGGMELASNSLGQEWAPNFGFTAPIGLAFSWGYRSNIDLDRYATNIRYARRVDRSPLMPDGRFLSGASGSLFFPLLDLGALVLFRLGNSDDPLPEDVGFQQVFSPGIIYTHGFADLPISVMGGLQISPQLRTINEQKANSFRFNFSIVVDLPMANFHTRSEMKE